MVCKQSLRKYLGAIPGFFRQQIVAVCYASGISKMFMQMIYEFNDTVFERRRYPQIVKDRQVLHAFAQADSARVGANRNVEFSGHQQHGKILVHARNPATVNLTDIDCAGLHELLEHNSIVAMLTRCDANGRSLSANASMAQNVVGAGG